MTEHQVGTEIKPYDTETILAMHELRLTGIPASFYLLDLRKTNSWCHHTSPVLAYAIKGSWITGRLPEIKSDDNTHSWVEKNEWVYDVSKGIMWKKDIYYQKHKPYDIITHSKEEIDNRLKNLLKYKRNSLEMYWAIILDIEKEIDKMPYGKILEHLIEDFKKEIKDENTPINENLLNEYMSELNKMHQETHNYIATYKEEKEKQRQ